MSLGKVIPEKPGAGQLWTWVRTELASFPGRGTAVLRLVLSMTLVILISMTLQVPFLSLSMIMVLFTAQENTVLTRLTGIVLATGVTLAVALGLLLVMFTIDYPLLRILGAFAIAFCGMYFMRVSRVGSIGYLVALYVFYIQSFVDLGWEPEELLRNVLWLWVAVIYPILITVAVNFVVLPRRPARMLTDEISRQLDEVLAQLEARRTGASIPAIGSGAVARGVLALHRHLAFATKGDAGYQRDKTRHLGRIAAVDRLHTAAAHLSRLPIAPLSMDQGARIEALEANLRALRGSIAVSSTFECSKERVSPEPVRDPLDTVLREMAIALQAFANAGAAAPAAAPKSEPLISADAFSNPAYGRFALKVMLSATLCYVFYTAVRWPGIHTSMLSAFILALPSLGATSHKGLLRIVGCILGSIVALLATVFVTPHLESITGLLLLTLPILAAGAWISAGSARSNYIGVQFVFAFALAQLGHFGPYSDIAEIRDRIVGILIGAAAFTFISALLWPEREGTTLRVMKGRLLRAVANLARAGRGIEDPAKRHSAIDHARLQGWSLLAQNRDVHARVALEPGRQGIGRPAPAEVNASLTQAQEAMLAVSWLHVLLQHSGTRMPRAVADAIEAFREHAAGRLEWMASRVDGQTSTEPGDSLPSALAELERSVAAAGQEAPGLDAIAASARVLGERLSRLHGHIVREGMEVGHPWKA